MVVRMAIRGRTTVSLRGRHIELWFCKMMATKNNNQAKQSALQFPELLRYISANKMFQPTAMEYMIVKTLFTHTLNLTVCLILLTLPAISSAGIYKCEENGKPIFSQKPCGDTYEIIEIKQESSKAKTNKNDYSSNLYRASAESSLKSTELIIRNIKIKIKRLENVYNGLRKKRDKKLAKLNMEYKEELFNKFRATIAAKIDKVKEQYLKDRKKYSALIHKNKLDLIDRERAYRIQASNLNKPLPRKNAVWCPCNGTYNCYDESSIRYCLTDQGIKRYRNLK